LSVLKRLQIMMDNRYAYLLDCERRKIAPVDTFQAYLIAIDEIAYFSATIGDKRTREDFAALLRDLVARGRAVGIIVIADATPVRRHHPHQPAGPVRVAVRRALHHQQLVRHHPRAGLGAAGLVREHDQPRQPRRGPTHHRGR
jgi:hypothetical protein